jgi:hypothetical protein
LAHCPSSVADCHHLVAGVPQAVRPGIDHFDSSPLAAQLFAIVTDVQSTVTC